MGTKGSVCETPEHRLQSRVLGEAAGVIRVGAWRGIRRGATVRGRGTAAAAVLFREDDAKGDTDCDEDSEGQCRANDLVSCEWSPRLRERTDNELGAFVRLLGLLEPLAVARGIHVLIWVFGGHIGSLSVARGL